MTIKSLYKNVLLLLVIGYLLAPLKGKGQSPLWDTISFSFHQKPKFLLDIGSYNSIVNEHPAIFTDFAAGVCFNKRFYFSAGISLLNTEVISSQTIHTDTSEYPVNAKLHMILFIASGEYVFWKDYPWIFSLIPLKVGVGHAYYEYISEPDKQLKHINEHTILTYNPQLYSSYNILNWFGLSGSIGYRFTPFSSSQIHSDLDSFTYSFGMKLFLDPIYDAVFPNGIFHRKKTNDVKM
jgi:hypothetical protein